MSEHVTFYVGEDLEFHTGKFAEGLTLDQAIARYRTIKRARGIKGIGIDFGGIDAWDLVQGETINISDLNYVPQIKERPETQEAIEQLKRAFPDFKVV